MYVATFVCTICYGGPFFVKCAHIEPNVVQNLQLTPDKYIYSQKKRTNGYIFHQNDECYNMTLYFSTKSDPKKYILAA